MDVYMAHVDRTRSSYCDFHHSCYGDDNGLHNIENEDDNEIHLTKVVDLDGKTFASGTPIELDEHFIQSEPFEDDPDEENFDYHHGSATHCYRKTVGSG